MNNTRIIFVDFDGPMIPSRAYFLPNQTSPVSTFDPCAVSLLLKLVEQSGAQLVISSTLGQLGRPRIEEMLMRNGINPNLLHKDWITPRRMSSSRAMEIKWWLQDHPEVTEYVAIDDEGLDAKMVPNSVLCDAHEGFSWRNYLECEVYLGMEKADPAKAANTKAFIVYLKRREIWRTKQSGERGQHLTWQAADLVFPRIDTTGPDDDTN